MLLLLSSKGEKEAMNNRAMEFLTEALKQHYAGWKARQFVKLAVAEVYELLEENTNLRQRLTALEGRAPATPDGDGRGVLIVDAQRATRAAATPAILTEQRRALAVQHTPHSL